MKRLRKVCSLIMAFVMVLALGISAQAADSYTITIDNSTSGHTYEAYQIFTGDLSDGVLSNVQWGSGVDSVNLLTALKADPTVGATFTNCATAADVASAMDKMGNDSTSAKAIAQVVGSYLSSTIAGTSTYASNAYTITGLNAGYYLVKDKNDSVTGEGDSYTRFILQVVANETVTPKSAVPTVTKTVDNADDSTTEGATKESSADYDIGDTVPFTLTGTLPSNYADYAAYKYTFHDTMAAGLTFDPNSVVVKVDGTPITTGYTVATSGLTDSCTFEVQFADLKQIPSITAASVITVEYNATLNSGAVIGSTGNPNTVSLEYSNNPNVGGSGNTGTTPGSTATVFTYQVIINKVDQNNAPLTGAAFTLEKYVAETNSWTPITVVANPEGTTFTFSGLDEGLYHLTETTTPAGYNTIDPVFFTVTAVTTDNTLTSLTAVQTDAAGTPLPTEFHEIIATFAPDLTAGSVTTNIVNNAGATLPSTGGIGTTIFYIVGGALMVGAAVLFVTKKKQSSHEN